MDDLPCKSFDIVILGLGQKSRCLHLEDSPNGQAGSRSLADVKLHEIRGVVISAVTASIVRVDANCDALASRVDDASCSGRLGST
jgi:hypothetical protein